MNITINNKEVELKYSFRALIYFEKIAGKSFTNVTGLTEILILFYSIILASENNISFTWDQFMDWLDENPNILTEFTNWLQGVMTKNNFISENDTSYQKQENTEEVDEKN